MKKKQRRITLLEVLIALSLTVVVLSAMMWGYRTVMEVGSKADRERQEAFRWSYVQFRLAEVLPLAQNNPFYLSQKGLVFQYNNAADLDKDFGNEVIARLYVDERKRFCLALMPAQKRWNEEPLIKQEVLLENVDEVHFRFFTLDEGWQETVSRLPAIVDVALKQGDHQEHYRFPLPNAEEMVKL